MSQIGFSSTRHQQLNTCLKPTPTVFWSFFGLWLPWKHLPLTTNTNAQWLFQIFELWWATALSLMQLEVIFQCKKSQKGYDFGEIHKDDWNRMFFLLFLQFCQMYVRNIGLMFHHVWIESKALVFLQNSLLAVRQTSHVQCKPPKPHYAQLTYQ